MKIVVCKSDQSVASKRSEDESRPIEEYQYLAQVSNDPSVHTYGRTSEEAVGRLLIHFAYAFKISFEIAH